MATTKVGIAPMKVAQISKPGGEFEIVEREIPNPGAGEVRIKVQACGVCHSDVFVKEGLWPGIQYPRVPGHEVAGVIDEIGAAVTGWKVGQRVGVGWRARQHVSRMPAWTVPLLPQPQSYRHHLRRRISAIHGRSGPSARGDTGHT